MYSTRSSFTAIHNNLSRVNNEDIPFENKQSKEPSVLTLYNSDELGTSQRSSYQKFVRRSQEFKMQVSKDIFL